MILKEEQIMGKVYEMLITKEKMQECIEFEYQYREDVPIFENDEDVVVSAYARVSSTKYEQIDAVKYQKSVLDKWLDNLCQINPNCHKGKIYVDTKTGRNFKRDAYQEMIEDAKRGRMNYIIFWETSRFGRNLSNVIRECLRLKDEYSVDLYFIDKQISTKTREGLAKLVEEANRADEQSKQTRVRVTRGINEKRRLLELNDDGYLYTHRTLGLETREGIKQKLFRVEDEVETLNMMAEKYLECRSLSATAKYLTSMARKTANGNIHWYPSTVLKILRNTIYVCIEEQNKTKTVTMDDYYNAKRTVIPQKYHRYVFMPHRIGRIWDDDYFLEIQKALDDNQISWNSSLCEKNAKDYRPYDNLLWCSCGAKFVVSSNKYKSYTYRFYECSYKKHRGSEAYAKQTGLPESAVCRMPGLSEFKLQMMAEEIIKRLHVSNEEIYRIIIELFNKEEASILREVSNEVAVFEKKIEELQCKINIHRRRMFDGLITDEEYKSDIAPVKLQIEEYKMRAVEKKRLCFIDSSGGKRKSYLENIMKDILDNCIFNEFIYYMVDIIVQTGENEFSWHLNLRKILQPEVEDEDIPKKYRIVYKQIVQGKMREVIKDSRTFYKEFVIHKKTAKDFKRKYNYGILRRYEDLHVKVYI